MSIWHERERSDRADGRHEPLAQGASLLGKGGTQRPFVCGDATPVRAGLADQERSSGDQWTPAEIGRNAGCQASLPVEGPKQLADVDDVCLELDHEQRS